MRDTTPVTLTLVIPCYNEERTLEACVNTVLAIQDETLSLELIIVDDCSKDRSLEIAQSLAATHSNIVVMHHAVNQGKGAAIRTGIKRATGDFVAIQDADLEYDPVDLTRLLEPLRKGIADVVLGSRFLSHGYHRVLYFWHSVGNRFLTLLSNMLTDLNLTDMETCYKVFRREVIQAIDIEENRFGFEPEVVAKVAAMNLRVYEMGISYSGRTYAEGKKIGMRDGWRALYCILHYNLPRAPVFMQFAFYALAGGTAAALNLILFAGLLNAGASLNVATVSAFVVAAAANYLLSIAFVFKRGARYQIRKELAVFLLVVGAIGVFDLVVTRAGVAWGLSPIAAKITAIAVSLGLNYTARRYVVFPLKPGQQWKLQNPAAV